MGGMGIEFRKLMLPSEAEWCASVMTTSEPWITLGRTREESLRIIDGPSKEVYLAAEAGELSGFMILNMNGAFIGYVQTICIAPGSRGRGLGTKLLEFAEERIFDESPNVFLCVSSFNEGARRLYERLGYETVGELKDYIIEGHSEILMRKTLGPLKGFNKKP
jgi:ribosomal protein S18 acetylase RimI-like enzyme